MSRHTGTKRVFALLVVATLVGCRDQPAGPELPATGNPDSGAPFFAYEPAPGFDLLRFTNGAKLPKYSASATIGPEGGVIKVGNDLEVHFPSGALSEPTEIGVRSSDADGLAYEFAPHGIRFGEPVVLRFALEGTQAEYLLNKYQTKEDKEAQEKDDNGYGRSLSNFKGVYFEHDPLVGNLPLETLPAFLDDDELVILIRHFSGYAVASG